MPLACKFRVNIIPCELTWEGLSDIYHKKYGKDIGLTPRIKTYIQTVILKKTLESITFERQRNVEEDDGQEEIERLANTLEEPRESGKPVTS